MLSVVVEYKYPRARKWWRIQYAMHRREWAAELVRTVKAAGAEVKPRRVAEFVAPPVQRF